MQVVVWFRTERGEVVSYSVILLARREGVWETVRVYDNAHGQNEMHRYTLNAGKEPAERIHEGDYGEAMRTARARVMEGFEGMVAGWER